MKDLTAVYFNNTVRYSGENRGLMNAVFTKIEGGDFSSCLIPEEDEARLLQVLR